MNLQHPLAFIVSYPSSLAPATTGINRLISVCPFPVVFDSKECLGRIVFVKKIFQKIFFSKQEMHFRD
jgi:hypothetical protein